MLPPGDQPGADVGPLISPEAKARVESLIQSGVEEGAELLLDGRNVNVRGYENGNFVGPTILGKVMVRTQQPFCFQSPNALMECRPKQLRRRIVRGVKNSLCTFDLFLTSWLNLNLEPARRVTSK